MKICQINCVYGDGSTGKIVRDIHNGLLSNKIDSYVLVPYTNKIDKNVITFSNKFLTYASGFYRRLTGRTYDGAYIQTKRIKKFIKNKNFDIVHLHCINGNNINIYKLLNFLAINKIKTVLTLHAEFNYTGGCEHSFECEKWKKECVKCSRYKKITKSYFFDGTNRIWKMQKKCYKKFDENKLFITAVSPWLANRAKQSPMFINREIISIYNPVDCDKYFYHKNTDIIIKKYNINYEKKIILFVTTIFDENDVIKGGKFLIEIANKLKNENYIFYVASNYSNYSNLPNNIVCLGKIKNDNELSMLYSLATLTLVLSKKETFSMITAESLCSGTPVVGFKAGGPESIAIESHSKFVEYGNVNEIIKYIKAFSEKRIDKQLISEDACNIYGKRNIINQYREKYDEIMRL